MAVNINNRINDEIDAAVKEKQYLIAMAVLERIRLRISTPGPPPSKPGQPPHLWRGDLLASWHIRETETGYQVTSNMARAYWLEFGTSKMAARPYIWDSIFQTQQDMGSIIDE